MPRLNKIKLRLEVVDRSTRGQDLAKDVSGQGDLAGRKLIDCPNQFIFTRIFISVP